MSLLAAGAATGDLLSSTYLNGVQEGGVASEEDADGLLVSRRR